ncbi:GNAT family N-acetyltransferase [Kitasatospora sp. NBC_01287]|uniref:GNAT family N-acetyltransferase n=1 Tax=Kitasatospora sp. NBC_01287 TaxID=2903573 RepID=UPI00224E5198|nr:GNAT family N-acetyltransferase [Kitasatospora sp. NBC_01287]MCX4749533.1 GNAT family N-acetyltransferase [Kitasatospora sp. NBC_01287]
MILRQVRDSRADAETVRLIATEAFGARADRAATAPGAAENILHEARTRHLARTDPAGCWLAEEDGRAIGFALSMRREGVWILALFCVLPEFQGKGVGRLLLERAAAHGRACLRGMIGVSSDPAAARRYRRAGYTLHPAMRLTGAVDRAGLLDAGDLPVHPGNAGHRDLLDSIDRRLRGAAHGPDHELMLAHFDEVLIADTLAGSGYCYRSDGSVKLLAATSKRLAVRLLREALARVPEGTPARVELLTAEQEWAVDVGLEVGLTLENRGYLALRGMRPPAPYLPNGAFL